MGFCWGGGTSFAYAVHQPRLDAAVVYYGTPPQDLSTLAAVRAPVLGLYGGDDARVTSTVDATREKMHALGKSYEPHVFDGAGHGFLRAQGGQNGANARAAAQALAADGELPARARSSLTDAPGEHRTPLLQAGRWRTPGCHSSSPCSQPPPRAARLPSNRRRPSRRAISARAPSATSTKRTRLRRPVRRSSSSGCRCRARRIRRSSRCRSPVRRRRRW